MRNPTLAIAVIIVLAVPNLALANDIYKKYGNIQGEATQAGHEKWIEAAPKHGTSSPGNKHQYLQYNLTNTMVSGHSLSAHPTGPRINVHPPTTTVPRVK